MKRLIIVGSPRTNGRSAHLAEMLFEANIDEHPEDELFLVPLSEIEVGPCIACDACRKKTPVTFKNDDGAEVTEGRHRCVFDDDMQTLYDLVDDVDEITIVTPIFFSGAPAQLKCLLDRLQPYFWAHGGKYPKAKRPATLHVIGEGGDPYGYDALVSEVKSALAVAGFRLERLLDWVGRIDADGEITAEAHEVRFDEAGKKQRPKLDLSAGKDSPKKGGKRG
ncbi:MAG: flavodoxin family protein [Eggerthellaceae bacterium]|nr:flavodoxin family protein [Eggerthellaceae bacterium]